MPTNRPSLNLRGLRTKLVGNCDGLVEQYAMIIGKWQASEAYANVYSKYTPGSRHPGVARTSSTGYEYTPDPKTITILISPAHAALVQEWIIFVSSVFGRAVLYFLETNATSRLPKQPLRLNKINPSSLRNMRESISEAVKESFSYEGYSKRIITLRSIFNIKEAQLENHEKKQVEELNNEMIKHVAIRNIFQHNRGKIRKDDLEGISPQYFELLNENRKKEKYVENDEIFLFWPEIEKLNQTIKNYSKKYEVLS